MAEKVIELSPRKPLGKFIPGKTYTFDPPVTTNSIPVCGGEWEQKTFSEGWCLKDEGNNKYAFQGKPDDNSTEHYFIVEWGKGSVAKESEQ